MPKVSIVMSVYNKGLYLRDAMDSILNQTYRDFELVIADNCSTDDSVDIIRSYDDTRIRFHQNPRNLWFVGSMNNCLDRASGDYVAVACGDDVWEEDFLQTCIDVLERHPRINVACCRTNAIDGEGKGTRIPLSRRADAYRIVSAEQVLQKLVKGCYILITAALFRRKAFPHFSIKYHYAGDWDMLFRVAEARNDFLFLEEPLVRCRFYPDSNTSVAKLDGTLVFESYLTLRDFFARQPQYGRLRRKAYGILAMSTLRVSRDLDSRAAIHLYHRLALLIYPAILLNPAFYMYLAVAQLFGPSGMRAMKKMSKQVTSVIKGIQGKAR
jgi:glycosyltransferase involved in cell wall biosynthesis